MGSSHIQGSRTLRARILTPVSAHEVRYLEDGVVTWDEGGCILWVGPHDGRHVDEDLRPGVLTPGFVDGHLHYPQCRIIGQAAGPLLQWLERSVFPEEARFADDVYAGAVAADFCDRMIRAGTTLAMVYGSSHGSACDTLLRAAGDRGLRLMAGPVWMDRGAPEPLLVPAGEAVAQVRGLVERWHGGGDGLLQVIVAPRFALSCSREMLAAAAALAAELGLWVTTHLSENPAECVAVRSAFGAVDYLAVYEDAGLVHDRTVLAHCVHLSADEWRRMAGARAVVAHCPDSNAFLGSGGLDTHAALHHAGAVCVGSDVAAGRTFRIPAVLAHAHDNALSRGVPLSLEGLFWMGTRGGALALGQSRIGAIEVGMEADLTLSRIPDQVESTAGVLGHLLFDRDRQGALGTWVRGRGVWSGGEGVVC